MRIINLHSNSSVEELIKKLKRNDRRAQRALFEKTSPKMLGVCRSYVSDLQFAEDCLLRGYMKVFQNIASFKKKGSFEGWMRRIMVNECLDFIRKNKSLLFLDEIHAVDETTDFQADLNDIDAGELLDALPVNYRTVFNLFVLEEYSHKEIAEKLGVSPEVSRTQLVRAKNKLKELILQKRKCSNENELGERN